MTLQRMLLGAANISTLTPDAWWKLDETSGTTAADSSGNGITGTLVNNPLWVSGKINNALDFNGTNQSVTLASNSILAMGSGSFTLAAWINPDELISGWNKAFSSPNGGAAFGIFRQPGPRYILRLTNTFVFDFAEGPEFTGIGVWSHIAVVMNRTDASLTYYLNSVAASRAYSATTFTSGVQTNAIGTNYPNGGSFDGKIDDVRIYKRALSATEITTLYQLG